MKLPSIIDAAKSKVPRLRLMGDLGIWWHIKWFWRTRVWARAFRWWHRHPRRSALWKAHYETHPSGYHPWFLGLPPCRYCRKIFWQRNRHMRGQEPPPSMFASMEIKVIEEGPA